MRYLIFRTAVYVLTLPPQSVDDQVIKIDHAHCELVGRGDEDVRTGSTTGEAEANRQRRSLLLELQAMTRLRSPYTVNVYGAITSRKDELVLVMELLTGGDLRSLLRQSKEKIPEPQAWKIIGDVSAGMAFLHSKNAVHGDLKSANVLIDGDGRAKVRRACSRHEHG